MLEGRLWRLVIVVAALALDLGVVRVVAQDAQRPTFRGGTDLVIVWATVFDRNGRAITDLRKEDFVLTEDDQTQEIALFGQDAQTPLAIVVAVDVSGSMEDKLENVEDALQHLAKWARPDDQIELIEFNTTVQVRTKFGTPRDQFVRALSRLTARGGTAMYDALVQALRDVHGASSQKKVVLLLTDGNDNQSRISLQEAVGEVTRSETLVYALGLGHGARGSFGHVPGPDDRVDIDVLRALTDPSGGRAELLENPHQNGVDLIDKVIGGFERELRQQYTLGYYPATQMPTAPIHRIRVSTRNPEYQVRARTEYSRKPQTSEVSR